MRPLSRFAPGARAVGRSHPGSTGLVGHGLEQGPEPVGRGDALVAFARER